MRPAATCHPERPHKARGLCKACYARERYANDPEYRERILAAARERHRERYANDPEYRERILAAKRERRARRKNASEGAAR